MSDFNLTNKIEEADEDTIEEYGLIPYEQEWIYVEDIKEFVKLLKEEIRDFIKFDRMDRFIFYPAELKDLLRKIDKLAGDKLK